MHTRRSFPWCLHTFLLYSNEEDRQRKCSIFIMFLAAEFSIVLQLTTGPKNCISHIGLMTMGAMIYCMRSSRRFQYRLCKIFNKLWSKFTHNSCVRIHPSFLFSTFPISIIDARFGMWRFMSRNRKMRPVFNMVQSSDLYAWRDALHRSNFIDFLPFATNRNIINHHIALDVCKKWTSAVFSSLIRSESDHLVTSGNKNRSGRPQEVHIVLDEVWICFATRSPRRTPDESHRHLRVSILQNHHRWRRRPQSFATNENTIKSLKSTTLQKAL